MATYNCSHLVRFAIESVLHGAVADWELLVVGDACTDDTGQVVAGFGDPRVTFANLTTNSGDQAVPNNDGLRRARGRYVAFLNQDDLFFPDHLGRCIDELERTGADLVWVPCAAIRPSTPEALGEDRWEAELHGVPPTPAYSPRAFYFASSWVFRRQLFTEIGPWRGHDELYVTPSQDWLFRAWASGASLRFLPHVSVLVLPSGRRPGSYVDRTTFEHEYFARRVQENDGFRERLLESAAVNTVQSCRYELTHRPLAGIARSVALPVGALLTRLGVHPAAATLALWSGAGLGGKGKRVRAIRRVTGLR
jgi:glycosyltransferase involved in cell wall biosynthesis